MSLRKKVEVAQKNVTDVYTQFLPTITALGALGYANYNEPGVVPNGSFSLEALLTVPLWDGGIRYGLLRQTRALADEASRQLEEARRQAQVQVDQADRGVALAQHQRDSAILARDLAAQTDELTKLGFETGRGTSLDLVLAAADLRQADINLALEEYGLVIARVDALLSRATCPW
jgi:outer membrane protein TolC